MTVIARFEVIPVRDGSMSAAIAEALRALEQHPVSYRTTATDTIIEADTVDQVFAAVQAAHQAIPDGRVITSVEVDEDRRRPQDIDGRVASVERRLGHPPQRQQRPLGGQQQQRPPGGQQPRPQQQQHQPLQQSRPVEQSQQAQQRPQRQTPPQRRSTRDPSGTQLQSGEPNRHR